jgi:hypothetical protein
VSLSSGPATYSDSSVCNAKTIAVGGLQITGGIDMGNYVLANTTATTTGNITLDSAYTNAEITAGTIALTPALPRQLTPSVPIPAASVLDLEFPVGSGGGTSGADGSAASGADTISQVIVTLVRQATAQLPGAVSVLVPEVIVSAGSGFSFPLPKAPIEAAGSGTLQVTLKNGKRLPSWLRYASGTKMFIATAMPAGALPIEVLLRTGAQRWLMVVTEKSSH